VQIEIKNILFQQVRKDQAWGEGGRKKRDRKPGEGLVESGVCWRIDWRRTKGSRLPRENSEKTAGKAMMNKSTPPWTFKKKSIHGDPRGRHRDFRSAEWEGRMGIQESAENQTNIQQLVGQAAF